MVAATFIPSPLWVSIAPTPPSRGAVLANSHSHTPVRTAGFTWGVSHTQNARWCDAAMPKKNNHQHNNSVAPQAARPYDSPSSRTEEPAGAAKTTTSVLEKSALEKSVERNVRPFIDLIDTLRGLQIERDIPIPQVRARWSSVRPKPTPSLAQIM